MSDVRKVLSFASQVTGWITASVTVRLAVSATYLAQAFLIASVLQRLLRGAGLEAQTGRLVTIGVLVVIRCGLIFAGELVATATAAATKQRLRDRVLSTLVLLGPGYTTRRQAGELRATAVESIEALENYYARFIPAVAVAILTPAAVVVILAVRDGWLALLLALIAVGAVVIPPLWSRPLAARSGARMGAYIGLGAEFLDTLQGMVTLKAFGAARRRRVELASSAQRLASQWIREMSLALVPGGIYTLAITGGYAAMIAVAADRVAAGGLGVSTLFLVLFLAREALRPITTLSVAFHTSYEATAGADRLHSLLDAQPNRPADMPTHETRPASATRGEAVSPPSLRFDRVSFTYPGTQAAALEDVSLTVEAGQTVAVVGASGAGKTTLAALLLRFYDPRHGRMLLDGTDIAKLTRDELYTAVSLVAQDTYLFAGTVRDNLALARPDATDEQIEAAARVADAHEFILALPDSYDTQVGERGLLLSGGQRQRLALARAVLADRPVLVLDEATASVDAATEAAIQAALERLAAERTTLVIAHRLSTVRDADRIVVLDADRVVESGTHDELLAHGGRYAHLIAAQHPTATRPATVQEVR